MTHGISIVLTGPRGESRPQSEVAGAVHVMKIATGQIEEETESPNKLSEYIRAGLLDGITLPDSKESSEQAT